MVIVIWYVDLRGIFPSPHNINGVMFTEFLSPELYRIVFFQMLFHNAAIINDALINHEKLSV